MTYPLISNYLLQFRHVVFLAFGLFIPHTIKKNYNTSYESAVRFHYNFGLNISHCLWHNSLGVLTSDILIMNIKKTNEYQNELQMC